MVVFETDRLVVRDWADTDGDRVFDIYRRWEVSRWLGVVGVRAGPGTAVRSRPGAVRVTCWRSPRCQRWRGRPGWWFPAR